MYWAVEDEIVVPSYIVEGHRQLEDDLSARMSFLLNHVRVHLDNALSKSRVETSTLLHSESTTMVADGDHAQSFL